MNPSFQRALITGATSGIGRELAILLSKKKIPLILTGRNQERLQEVSELCNSSEAQCISADLNLPEERMRVALAIKEEIPDLIINNAGFGIYGSAVESEIDQQLAILEINAKVVCELTLLGAKTLIKSNRKGVILNISSVAGEYATTPGMSVYGAAKAFVTHFSESLDFELKPYGIRVLVACPGMVETDFANRAAGKNVESKKGPVIPVQSAADAIWRQIERGKGKNIFDWRYWIFSYIASKIVPKKVISKLIWKRISSRI